MLADGSDGEAIFVATDEVGEGAFSAVVPNLIGMGCGYGGAFLALCAAAANFFTRCVCSQGTAASTLFWTSSHAFLSPMLSYARRAPC